MSNPKTDTASTAGCPSGANLRLVIGGDDVSAHDDKGHTPECEVG
ncbi:MAG TPA: hypothetical protein VHZ24_16890 [Pirellulales bacterium]|nr:hypothetical protein [Pirellulales bacterium]